MNTPLDDAIIAYFDALTSGVHNTAYISVGGRFYNTKAPQGCESPYIVFSTITNTPDYYFQDTLEDYFMQFSIYSTDPSEVDTILGYMKTLFDNSILSMSGSDCLICQRQSIRSFLDLTEGVYQGSMDYLIKVQ